ncbi:ATP-binding protein [Streptomyces sp. NPDC051219]|uniref:ATP-binding protein n=1 Tax=Streptomyces sp. NPDC051219 TaxID=3155283 RepID=UPI0034253866
MAAQLNTMLPERAEYVHSLPPVPGAVSAMRRRARAVLADWNLSSDVAEDAILVISELLTNAIVHALPPAELRLSWVQVDGLSALRVEVTDAGPALAAGQSLVRVDPDEQGRGQGIVHALAARHGVRVESYGIIRWADLTVA